MTSNTCFLADVELFDPKGQSRLNEGETYGGERILLAIPSDTAANAILRALGVIEDQGVELREINQLIASDEFEPDVFDFHVTYPDFISDALQADRICRSRRFTHEPFDVAKTDSGVQFGIFDFFDPSRLNEAEPPYAGELCAVAMKGGLHKVLRAVLAAMAADELVLYSIEGFSDCLWDEATGWGFQTSLQELIAETKSSGGIVFTDAIAYEAP